MFDKDVWEAIKLKRETGCKSVECKVVDENIKLRKKNNELNKELETYKKIAEKLASVIHKNNAKNGCDIGKYGLVDNCKGMTWCNECIIDWARKEVEKSD